MKQYSKHVASYNLPDKDVLRQNEGCKIRRWKVASWHMANSYVLKISTVVLPSGGS